MMMSGRLLLHVVKVKKVLREGLHKEVAPPF